MVKYTFNVESKIDELNKYGYILPGHNGPYFDNETPLRNTSHFANILRFIQKRDNTVSYETEIRMCGDYILSQIDENYLFCFRDEKNKDKANGVIGPAWLIEGLVGVYDVTGDDKYICTAISVFNAVNFDENIGLWKTTESLKKENKLDYTFNHQLWLATAGVQILDFCDSKKVKNKLDVFFKNFDQYFEVYSNGLIRHSVLLKNNNISNVLLNKVRRINNKHRLYYKENGYHLFNMYALAIIYSSKYRCDIFTTKKFLKALKYSYSNDLYKWLTEKNTKYDKNIKMNLKFVDYNIYGFGYNAPGFELPFISTIFKVLGFYNREAVLKIEQFQYDNFYNENSGLFQKNTEDINVLNMRFYEYLRTVSKEGED
jgi:hypothetical protein